MTAHEALWLMKVQLQRTEQNIQAIKVLEDIVKEHLFGDVEYDLSKLTLVDEPKSTTVKAYEDTINHAVKKIDKVWGLDEALSDEDIDYVWVNNYTLDEALDDDEPTYTLDEAFFEVFGTEAQHIKNHMAKVGTKDIQELEKVEQTCARYELAEEE